MTQTLTHPPNPPQRPAAPRDVEVSDRRDAIEVAEMAMFRYRGYTALPVIDAAGGVIGGQALAERGIISFEGQTVREAQQSFREGVEDYLALCAEAGREPGRPLPPRNLPPGASIDRAVVLRADGGIDEPAGE